MVKIYTLPRELRREIAAPMGPLFPGMPDKSLPLALNWIREQFPGTLEHKKKAPKLRIICVGDIISKAILDHPILQEFVKMCFVDDVTQRGTVISWKDSPLQLVELNNPRGTISSEVIDFIHSHFKDSGHYLCKIIGEEDLLVIPAVLESDANTLIFYGQPPITDFTPPIQAGCVALRPSPELQQKLTKIFEKFTITEEPKK